MEQKDCAAAILAGGRSRRMGRDKAMLQVGGETMLSRLVRQLDGFGEILLSADNDAWAEGLPLRVVPDRWKGCGPLGGLEACLAATERTALFVVPCDLPGYQRAVADYLFRAFREENDAIVCRDGSGRLHPLCGIYRKRALPKLEACLANGTCRVTDFLACLEYAVLGIGGLLPDGTFCNMNTPGDYAEALAVWNVPPDGNGGA